MKKFFMVLAALLFIPLIFAGDTIVSSVKIPLTQFGGVEIRQTATDDNYPCYLLSSGKIRCRAITPENYNILSRKYDLIYGIPYTDFRTGTKQFLPDNYTVDFESRNTGIIYNKHYLNYYTEQLIIPDIFTRGRFSIGFSSNNFSVSDYSYGTCRNCSAQYTGVALDNYPLNCTGTVVCMPFTINATDYSGNNHHGNVSGAAHNYTQYDFNSVGDQLLISANDDFNALTQISILFWVYPNDEAVYTLTWLLYYSGTDKVESYIDKTGYFYVHNDINNGGSYRYAGVNLTKNKWYHIGWTYDSGGTGKIYVNGLLEDTKAYAVTMNDLDDGYKVYVSYTDTINIEHSVSDFIMFNRPLSQPEILERYQKGLYLKTPNYGNYSSEVSGLNASYSFTNATWAGDFPAGTDADLYVYSSEDNVTWSSPAYCPASPCNISGLSPGNYTRFDAVINTINFNITPYLKSVIINFEAYNESALPESPPYEYTNNDIYELISSLYAEVSGMIESFIFASTYAALLYIGMKYINRIILGLCYGIGFLYGFYLILQYGILGGSLNFIRAGIGLMFIIVNAVLTIFLFIFEHKKRELINENGDEKYYAG